LGAKRSWRPLVCLGLSPLMAFGVSAVAWLLLSVVGLLLQRTLGADETATTVGVIALATVLGVLAAVIGTVTCAHARGSRRTTYVVLALAWTLIAYGAAALAFVADMSRAYN
jgi:hypothetical protein